MFKELKTALFVHPKKDIYSLAKKLLYMATKGGAMSLNQNTGELKVGKTADIISLTLTDKPTTENLCLSVLLHKKQIQKVYIAGRLCYT
jgi:cytosine/adenosine deaminase-related metal-dependent hydrolase